MTNPNKQKGTRWESEVRDYLRGTGLDYEGQKQMGADDEGDGVIRTRTRGLRFVVEAKAEKAIRLPEYARQVFAEVKSYAERRRLRWKYDENPISDPREVYGVTVVKARGRNVKDGYVVLSLQDFADIVARFL